jgi:hypothetical protein
MDFICILHLDIGSHEGRDRLAAGRATTGATPEAIKTLNAILAEATTCGYLSYQLAARLESLMLESTRLRNNFRSGILAPQRRLRKRCKRLTPMQIS